MNALGTVLVVGAVPADLKLLADLLAVEGFQVLPADSGERLVPASAAARTPDLILLDIRGSDMDGFEVLRRLKADEAARDIPVVLISGVSEVRDRVEGLRLGAVDFISKPIQPDEILARVKTHLELQRLRLRLQAKAEALREANEGLDLELTERKQSEARRQAMNLELEQAWARLEAENAELRAQIEERQRADTALRVGEERLRLALQAARQGLYDLDVQTGEAVVSPEYATMLGYDPRTFVETNAAWLERLHPQDRERVGAAYIDYIEGRSAEYRVEFRQRTRSGDWKWILSQGSLVERTADGRPLRMLGTHTDITERKLAESALRESHDRFELANRATFNVIWDWDIAKGTFWRNDNFQTLFGYSVEDLAPATHQDYDLIHPEDEARVRASIEAALAGGGEHWTETYRFRRKDGTFATVEDRGVIVRGAGGRALRMLGAMQDVTQRIQAEEALREREQRYRSLFENMLHGFAYCRMIVEPGQPLDFVYLAVNEAFGTLTGLGNPVGRRVSELVPGIQDADSELLESYARVAAGGPPERFERHVESMGMWFAISAYSPAPGHFVALFDVITQRKEAEAALRESEEKLRRIVEHSMQVFYSHTVDNVLTYVSPQAEAFFEVGPEGFDRPWTDFLTDHPGNAEGLERTRKALETGERQPPYELELQTAAGRRIWVEVNESPVLEGGRPVAMVGALTDITAHRGAQEQLRLQSSALEAAANAIVITDRQGVIKWANPAFTTITGYGVEEAWNRTPGELLKSGLHGEAFYREMWDTLLAGRTWQGELVNRRKDGSLYDEEMTITPVKDASGAISHFVAVKQDVTQRRRAEVERASLNRSLKMLSACNEALVRVEDEQELLNVVCQVIVDIGGYRMAWVGYAMEDPARSVVPAAWAGAEDGYLGEIRVSWAEDEAAGQGPAGLAIRGGRPSVLDDVASDPAAASWREAMLARGYRSVVALPLRFAGRAIGVLALYKDVASHHTAEDLELLQELVDDLAYGIGSLRARKEREQMERAVLKMAQGVSGKEAGGDGSFFDLMVASLVEALGAHGGLLGRVAGPGGDVVQTLALVLGGDRQANIAYALAGTPCEQVQGGNTCVIPKGVQARFPADAMLAQLGLEGYAGTPLRDSRGRFLGLLAVFFTEPLENPALVESTLRVFAARAEGELERLDADQRLREQASLLDEAHDAILVRDMEHRLRFWNQGAQRLYGWTSQEALGCSIVDLLYRDPGDFAEAQAILLADGEWSGRLFHRHRDGRDLVVEGRWTLVRDEAGAPRSVLAINTDITDRERAEAELARYTERLEALRGIDAALLGARGTQELAQGALARLRHIIPFDRASVVLFDPEQRTGTFLAVDQESPWEPVAGEVRPMADFRDPHELTGAPFVQLPDLTSAPTSPLERQLAGQGLHSLVYLPMLSDGQVTGYLALYAVHPGGLTPEHAEIALDMTDQLAVALQHTRLKEALEVSNRQLESNVEKRTAELRASLEALQLLEEELRQREAEARAASEAKSTFLASMSHELRTPLIGVTGMLEILGQSGLTAEQRQMVEIIHDSSASLLQIIGDILDFSKIEANKLELSPQPFSARALVESVANTFRPALSAKGLDFSVEVDPALAPAHVADTLRIRQILNNFMSNAVKFTESGSVALRLRATRPEAGREVLAFEVEDTGIGVSEEHQAKLFAPFTQAEASTTRRFGGTGLGLAISRRLADLMGGTLGMRSAPGAGTTLTLRLELPVGDPALVLGAANDGAPANPSPRPAPTPEQAVAERSLVLLAEDHPTNRIVITQQVNRAGFALEVSEDGEDAFRLWKTGRFSVVLTDLHMPRMDGYQLTRAIRDWEAAHGLPRTPILALTANALGGEAQRCLDLGMDDYLVKPVTIPLLAEKLNRWLPHIQASFPHPAATPAWNPLAKLEAGCLLALGDSEERVLEILREFIGTTRRDLLELMGAVDRKDRETLVRQAHRIRGASAMVGAADLASRAARLESLGRDGVRDWADLARDAAELEVSLADLAQGS